LVQSPLPADLPLRLAALCRHAQKLTRRPADVTPDDITLLRRAGLSDREILDASLVTAYFAYANRLADGLGVDSRSDAARSRRRRPATRGGFNATRGEPR
jgi:uncharacterized peroxidase-related enzyme